MSLLLLFTGGGSSSDQPTGGWTPRDFHPGFLGRHWTDDEEAVRLLEERIRLGIIAPPFRSTTGQAEPEPEIPAAGEARGDAIAGGTLPLLSPETLHLSIDALLARELRYSEMLRKRRDDEEFLMLFG